MSTSGLIKPEGMSQKIQLVKGEFTPSEASDVIMALIGEKINFHKIQRLQKWEQNHNDNSEALDYRIEQLENEKQSAKEFIASATNLKYNITINGVLQIAFVENQL